MSLPRAVVDLLVAAGVPAETLAGLADLHRLVGPRVLLALEAVIAERSVAPAALGAEHLDLVRRRAAVGYVRECHPRWSAGSPTPAFWRERDLGEVATGLAAPLGDLEGEDPLLAAVRAAVGRAGGDHPRPRGLVLFTRNAHVGDHPGAFSFDLVPSSLDDAESLAAAEGRQNTLPGSVGEASGRLTEDPAVALLWEVQPNVFKPAAERNRRLGPVLRRHRAWPMVVAGTALAWLRERGYRTFVVRGAFLRATHEVDPARPLGPEIARLHDLTTEKAAAALGHALVTPSDPPEDALRALAKLELGRAMDAATPAAVVREVVLR